MMAERTEVWKQAVLCVEAEEKHEKMKVS